MRSEKTQAFLEKHNMLPERTDPSVYVGKMLEEMRRGLDGKPCSMDMIPAYLSNDGELPPGLSAVIIDAGGTNFRRALVSFSPEGCRVSDLLKTSMPGISESCSWEEFIRFVADSIEPLMPRAAAVGFCFSYSAEITPELDGRVISVDKEVVIRGSEGKLIGADLRAELEKRGISGKRVVILNDTAAVLLGGAAALNKSAYSGFIGQVTGTGANTCVVLPAKSIGKLGSASSAGMVVNTESGKYDGLPRGDFDLMLDTLSHNPGEKQLEKMTSGVYLGKLGKLALLTAAKEGILGAEAAEYARTLGDIDASVIDAWAAVEGLDEINSPGDRLFISELGLSLFDRAARCMCINLLALTLLADAGKTRPMCIIAEGSLVQKSRFFRPFLEKYLDEYGRKKMALETEYHIGSDSTVSGSAAAALLNLN